MTLDRAKHVVLGAGGGTGGAVLRELALRELPTRAVGRKPLTDLPPGVESVTANVMDPLELAAALEGASVVYHCAQPDYTRWPQEFPPMNRAVIDAAAAVGTRLVFADNFYMYGLVGGPMTEMSSNAAAGKKGKVRAQMAAELLQAHNDGRVRAVIARSSDYYGPGGIGTAMGDRVFNNALKGKKVSALGSLDQPHTLSYLPDMARAIAVLGSDERSEGEIWHLPAAETLTVRQFLALVFEAAGTPPKMGLTPPAVLALVGIFVPLVRELKETRYQWDAPFVSDASKFQTTFGPFEPTPHAEAVVTTTEWFRKRIAAGSPG